MTTPLHALLGFASWAIVLVAAIAAVRVSQVLRGEKKANEFPGGSPHGGDAYWRLNRAQANTVENLPIFGAIVVAGTLLHVATPAFATLPLVVLGARVVQSVTHISSGSVMAVNVRFTAFLTQLGCFGWMIVEIVRGG
ncbi:MAG: MAPEG family protein [Myxococcales bacterium]|nr:MAPEG family protein [Myxococcales bacterium]